MVGGGGGMVGVREVVVVLYGGEGGWVVGVGGGWKLVWRKVRLGGRV